jgi:integrase
VVAKRSNGEGSIRGRTDGWYEGRYVSGGRQRSVYGKTRRETAKKLAEAQRGEVSGDTPRAENAAMTVREFFGRYDAVARGTMKRRGYETYQDIARLHLLPEIGDGRLSDLSREDVQALYGRKRDAGLSAARVRRIHGALSAALNAAVRWRLVDRNVCKEASPPRVPAPEIRAFNAEEAKRFLEAAQSDRFHALYVLGLTTGARIGELGGVSWSDLDLDRKVMRLQRALITGRGGQTFEPPKTPNSRRSIGLSRRAVDALERHRERQGAEGFPAGGDSLVFTNTVGGPVNPSHLLCRSFKPLLRDAGLQNTTFHAATRHTFCCLALQQGVNARTVSLAMGHSSVAFTLSKYASYIPNYGDTAIGMDEALGQGD